MVGWLDKVVESWGGLITKWHKEVFGDNGTFVIVQVITWLFELIKTNTAVHLKG